MNTYRIVIETRYRTAVTVQASNADEAVRLAWETPDGERDDEHSEVVAIQETVDLEAIRASLTK